MHPGLTQNDNFAALQTGVINRVVRQGGVNLGFADEGADRGSGQKAGTGHVQDGQTARPAQAGPAPQDNDPAIDPVDIQNRAICTGNGLGLRGGYDF